jgi:hypothetical protein
MWTMLDLRKIDLRKLNSMTKYPSIPTYHTLGERGALTEDAIAFTGRVIGREKIDGTNARMVFVGDGRYLLGSREEFLYARGDLIGNPALGIVDALRETADAFTAASPADGALLVCYGEIYGGNVTAGSKQYTGEKRVGFRVFDVATIPNVTELLTFAPERIAAWREDGGQTFHAEEDLRAFSSAAGLELAPPVYDGDATEIGRSIDDAFAFLDRTIERSNCVLDDKAGGQPEGIVVRTPDRRQIAKLRFEDYEKIRRRKKQ